MLVRAKPKAFTNIAKTPKLLSCILVFFDYLENEMLSLSGKIASSFM